MHHGMSMLVGRFAVTNSQPITPCVPSLALTNTALSCSFTRLCPSSLFRPPNSLDKRAPIINNLSACSEGLSLISMRLMRSNNSSSISVLHARHCK